MAKCGMECEIFSRVTGYIRPTKFWNRGKKAEFKDRKMIDLEKTKVQKHV
jgi:ribonucleoside-triphosphate reductase